ncbi:hypothetical protein PRZ48_000316 [Zasmidium cellare]|uniref:Trafficking protein particle complex subunit 11 n=1 Tax=Zasmidium cellare TaxID=395010 RepID=A0ABR0EY45_ZASCE|nr:hypothetical protein PRZ48_000316 [Zasmidium cellare]
MEAYPPQYTEHNLPLVLLSGFGEQQTSGGGSQLHRQESGARIVTESAECENGRLLQEFLVLDGSDRAWNAASLPGPSGAIRYRMKTIGRSYTLPARKAAPLPQSATEGGGSPPPRNTELHSPLSPLSPGSPVFPDGVMTPLWLSKHQEQVPATFLSFFNLNAGEGASQDEQIKSDINAVRNALSRSGFKTRFAAVLISDSSILHAPELEDRLASIRRATTLDPKTGLFFVPPMSSQAEIATYVQTLMAALQPLCVEYYRDLTKHARRKKARGGPPPQVNSPVGGASQSTSTSGWNVRYEFKQGVFAEFRQELDVAERHYSAAIEELFSSEGGVLETTHSWSPRFNEARLLCDAAAMRVIRCQLWHGQTTGAAQSWTNYKLRMRDLIDRRGKGSETYSWEAWEARWAQAMSQLIQMADVPALRRAEADEPVQQVYSMPERPIDRLPPFNFLHHSGYWLRLLAKGIRARWERALAIPDEDRVPPGQSPASMVASRSKNYDSYLALDPHEEMPLAGEPQYDHANELGKACIQAAEEFEARRQMRMSEQTRLDLADDLVRVGRHSDALKVLTRLWEESTWREDDWLTPFGRLLRLLSDCATKEQTPETARLIPALTWELLSVAPVDMPESSLDIGKCLDAWDLEQDIELNISDKNRLSPISISFAWKDLESHVGEPMECQLVLAYETSTASKPLLISDLEFKIGERTVRIRHEGISKSTEYVEVPAPKELEDGTLETASDLTFQPSQRKILNLSLNLREAQVISVTEAKLLIEATKFRLTHQFDEDAIQASPRWYVEKDGEVKSVQLAHMDAKSINVLPKPPKMQVHIHGLRKQYFTDEQIRLSVDLVNEEAEAVHATIAPKVIGQAGETTTFKWADADDEEPVRTFTDMNADATQTAELTIQGPPEAVSFTLTLDLRYTLLSDPSTPLAKTVSVELPFVMPFDAKFTFTPRLHEEPWPSYFDASTVNGTQDSAVGIPQLWKLGAQIISLVNDTLTIESAELSLHAVQGDATCSIPNPSTTDAQPLPANASITPTYALTTTKHSLDDRRPSYLDLSLLVTWSHASTSPLTKTTIPVPRLTIPTSEPRVLCTSTPLSPTTLALTYHLENPSTHFLTFALTMEASSEYAFSGPKYRTLSLGPLSRHRVDYRIFLHEDVEEGVWKSVNLQVVDSYYQKNLRVHPGGERVRVDAGTREVVVRFGGEE